MTVSPKSDSGHGHDLTVHPPASRKHGRGSEDPDELKILLSTDLSGGKLSEVNGGLPG